jgi:hypothetical protein
MVGRHSGKMVATNHDVNSRIDSPISILGHRPNDYRLCVIMNEIEMLFHRITIDYQLYDYY